MFLEKDKVDIKVTVSSTTVIPGDSIVGRAVITVKQRIECTRVYVKLRCKEKVWIEDESDDLDPTAEDFSEHFSTYTLFQGRGLEDSSRGGCFLEEGVNEFPFTFTLPSNLPATLDIHTDEGRAVVCTKLTCVVDIPMGFDAKKKVPITVLPAMPQNLFCQGVKQTTEIGSATLLLYRFPSFACSWCVGDGTVTLSATGFPRVLALPQPDDSEPASTGSLEMGCDAFRDELPNSHTARLLMTCENNTDEEMVGVKVKLLLEQEICIQDQREWRELEVASVKEAMNDNPILPGTTQRFVITMPISKNARAENGVAPSQTRFTRSRLRLEASVASLSRETEPLVAENPFVLTAVLDGSNRVPAPQTEEWEDDTVG